MWRNDLRIFLAADPRALWGIRLQILRIENRPASFARRQRVRQQAENAALRPKLCGSKQYIQRNLPKFSCGPAVERVDEQQQQLRIPHAFHLRRDGAETRSADVPDPDATRLNRESDTSGPSTDSDRSLE